MHGLNYYILKKLKRPKKTIIEVTRVLNDGIWGDYLQQGVWFDPNQKCDKCGAKVTYCHSMGLCEKCKKQLADEIIQGTTKGD